MNRTAPVETNQVRLNLTTVTRSVNAQSILTDDLSQSGLTEKQAKTVVVGANSVLFLPFDTFRMGNSNAIYCILTLLNE